MNIAATQATVLSSADPAPQVETPQTIPLWRALITGPGGLPDEAALVFLLLQPLFFFGVVFNAVKTGHFAYLDVSGAETAIIFLYNVSIGARAKLGSQ